MGIVNRLKNKATAILKRLTKNRVYEVAFGGVKITRRGGLGFLKKGDSPEQRFLAGISMGGYTVYDIGGYIGLMAVLFSKKSAPAGQVIVFEPNEDNVTKINEHLELNKSSNVKIIKLGIGETRKTVSFIVSDESSATGSMDEHIQEQLKSAGAYKEMTIEVDALDNVVARFNLAKPDFIKVDIEGMEFPALLGMHETVKKHTPRFFIEIHGASDADKAANISNVFNWFNSMSYTVYHVESQQFLNKDNLAAGKKGHVYCTHPSNP